MDSATIKQRPNTGAASDVLADLLARTALRDQRAFQQLYSMTSPPLFGVLLHLLRSHAVAEEILHESFISIWRQAGTYLPARSQPMTWMTGIVRGHALDYLRAERDDARTRDGEDAADFIPDTSPGALEQTLLSVQSATLRNCVQTLDENARQVIGAAFYRGLSHGQLAQEFKAPLGTVKSWIRRGLQRLRTCIETAEGMAE